MVELCICDWLLRTGNIVDTLKTDTAVFNVYGNGTNLSLIIFT